MPVDPAQVTDAIQAIEKKYGEDAVHFGNEGLRIKRISTGSLELDYITGGGIPIGRVSRFYGGFSSGKSLTCWNVIRNAQQQGLTCAYYNIEKDFDEDYVPTLGVDLDKLIVVEGTEIEAIGTKLEAFLGSVHLHVIDSYSSTVSIDELDSDMEQWHMMLNPRVWSKVWKRVNERFDRKENAIILVDQVRDVIGPMGGEKPPGGRIPEHISSMTLHFKKGKWLFRDPSGALTDESSKQSTLSGQKEADGQEVRIRVEKSRVCRPLRSATLRIDFSTNNFDHLFELVKAAKYFKVVETTGSWYTLPGGERVQGQRHLRDAIAGDPVIQASIREAMFAQE